MLSSQGHIRDIEGIGKHNIGIDFEHGYTPNYVLEPSKLHLIDTLRKEAGKADTVWLASDEDREGEAIAWHLKEVLNLQPANTHRIAFHEITETAIKDAIAHPRDIDYNLVNAQQARRVLDRIVGFELSPVLWRKVTAGLSAGRVQSVAVRLVVEREREIEQFVPTAQYKVSADGGTMAMSFKTNLEQRDNLQIMYTKQDWISWPDNARAVTRGEWTGKTGTLYITPNTTTSTRTAAFVLSIPSDDGGWMGLDTAYVSQTGINDHYESSDFTADGTVTVMQKSSIGKGIPVVLMGDGFTDKDILDSTYQRVMEKSMENFFSEEPVSTLRDYFDVYAVTAVSQNNTVGEGFHTAFSTVPSNISSIIEYDDNQVAAYVNKVEGIDLENTLAVVIVNSHSHNGVTNLLFDERSGLPRQYAVSLCTLMDGIDCEEFRQVLVHEAVGHGLAKLADEYGYENNVAPTDLESRRLKAYHKFNWMLNVDNTDDKSKVLWSQFIGNSSFTSENIGIYEGGYTYSKGIYRPTEESMMRHNQSPFNAPSRKAIFDRIMALAEDRDASTPEAFAEFDEQHKPVRWNYATTRAPWQRRLLAPPIIKWE